MSFVRVRVSVKSLNEDCGEMLSRKRQRRGRKPKVKKSSKKTQTKTQTKKTTKKGDHNKSTKWMLSLSLHIVC